MARLIWTEPALADLDEIRRNNSQRYEMEKLSVIVFDDYERMICAGYKDITPQEFWVRGHFPGMPLMPGVIMLEAAAQLASYYTQRHKLMETAVVGFGGLKDVRFRGVVRPGDRFVVLAQMLKLRRSILTCRFQCLVRQNLVCEGELMGIPLPADMFKDVPTD